MGALESIAQQAADLVLLGYLVPDVSGRTVLRTLRQAHSSLPVILMTDFGSEDVAPEDGLSKLRFRWHFKEVTRFTFREFTARVQIPRAIELLRDPGCFVTDVYLDKSFKDLSQFGQVFHKITGWSPSRLRFLVLDNSRQRRPRSDQSASRHEP